jgi:hypothetical protein
MRVRQSKTDFVMTTVEKWQNDPSACVVRGAAGLEKYFIQLGHRSASATFLGSVDSGALVQLRYRVDYDEKRKQASLL